MSTRRVDAVHTTLYRPGMAARKKAAPKAPDSKGEVIPIRVTAEEKALLQAAADREGLGVSAWLRRLGLLAARAAE